MAEKKRHISVTKTNQEIADRVNETLPVKITAQDVEESPGLVQLLTHLSQHVTDDGLSSAVQKDLTEAQGGLRHEKSKWLEFQVLYSELSDLLLDHQLEATASGKGGSTSSSCSQSELQFYRAVQECLTLAEVGDYLQCHPDPNSKATLLGLKKEDLQRRNPHRRHLQAIQQKLIPEVESRLRKKCEVLVNFHDTNSRTGLDNGKFTFAKASQLPSILEAELQKLEEEKKQLKKARGNRERQYSLYYASIMESLHFLEDLITKHRLHSQSQRSKITSEWLVGSCDALCLKIKLLELQLLCDTYYTETVQALSTIRKHLDSAVSLTQGEIQKASHALRAYEAVGMGFDSLVNEYTELADEIGNKKWALRELKHSLENK